MSEANAPDRKEFDPLVEIQKLRDHLASHEKPMAFLFGAGTSAGALGTDNKPLVPAVADLTKRCEASIASLGDEFATAWQKIFDSLPSIDKNIEGLLSRVRSMKAVVVGDDKLVGLDREQLGVLEEELQKAISKEARPGEERFPNELPHAAIGKWVRYIDRLRPVEIFTTNYDTLIERALEGEWVPVFDGFVGSHRPFFSSTSLARDDMSPGRRWVRLWKIHGSITWTNESTPEGSRVVRGEESDLGQMILPSLLKYDESRKQPYVAMMDRLKRVLSESEDTVLVSCGYSFQDQHINEVIFESLEANPRLHLFALCFDDPAENSLLALAAEKHRNILAFGKTIGIIGGKRGTWMASDRDSATRRLDGLFSPSPDATEDGTAEAAGVLPTHVSGEVLLGDINKFCLLLSNIVGADA